MSDREQFCLQAAQDIAEEAVWIVKHSTWSCAEMMWREHCVNLGKLLHEFERALDAIPCDHFGTDRIDGKCAWCGEEIEAQS
jgi:hypothetical protein